MEPEDRPPRIGMRMLAATLHVKDHPGCSKREAARYAGPGESLTYGYRTVDRTIAAGLIKSVPEDNRYKLYITAAGQDALRQVGGA